MGANRVNLTTTLHCTDTTREGDQPAFFVTGFACEWTKVFLAGDSGFCGLVSDQVAKDLGRAVASAFRHSAFPLDEFSPDAADLGG